MRSAALMAVLLLAACAQLQTPATPATHFDSEPGSATAFLRFMDELDGMNSRQWNTAYKQIRVQYERDTTSANRLRLALALGNPGRPAADLEKSIKMLEELLTVGNSLPSAQYYVARTRLASIRKRAALETENQALRASLTMAEAKIRALTSLETNRE